MYLHLFSHGKSFALCFLSAAMEWVEFGVFDLIYATWEWELWRSVGVMFLDFYVVTFLLLYFEVLLEVFTYL